MYCRLKYSTSAILYCLTSKTVGEPYLFEIGSYNSAERSSIRCDVAPDPGMEIYAAPACDSFSLDIKRNIQT
jgi:hypothetical protein